MLEGKDNIVYVLINEAMPATFMTCSPTSRLRCRRSRGKTVSTADGQGILAHYDDNSQTFIVP